MAIYSVTFLKDLAGVMYASPDRPLRKNLSGMAEVCALLNACLFAFDLTCNLLFFQPIRYLLVVYGPGNRSVTSAPAVTHMN